jgi:micrococcal nuclease
LGKTVEIRGWLNKSRSHFSLLIRHPSAIRQRDNI